MYVVIWLDTFLAFIIAYCHEMLSSSWTVTLLHVTLQKLLVLTSSGHLLIMPLSFPARPTLWDMDFTNQLSLWTNQTPRNGLEEMIQWTKEGKLWQYPINNEAGE